MLLHVLLEIGKQWIGAQQRKNVFIQLLEGAHFFLPLAVCRYIISQIEEYLHDIHDLLCHKSVLYIDLYYVLGEEVEEGVLQGCAVVEESLCPCLLQNLSSIFSKHCFESHIAIKLSIALLLLALGILRFKILATEATTLTRDWRGNVLWLFARITLLFNY